MTRRRGALAAAVASVAAAMTAMTVTARTSPSVWRKNKGLSVSTVAKGGLARVELAVGNLLNLFNYQLPLPLRGKTPLRGEGSSPSLTAIVTRSQNDECSHACRAALPLRSQRSSNAPRRRTVGGQATLAPINGTPGPRANSIAATSDGKLSRRGKEQPRRQQPISMRGRA